MKIKLNNGGINIFLPKAIMSTLMIILIIGSACAASNITNGSSTVAGHKVPAPETSHGKILPSGQNLKAANIVKAPASATVSYAPVSEAVPFTSIPASGTMMDSTKKIAVYMPAMTNWVWSESQKKAVKVDVTFDPMTTAMLSEFNPDYIGDSTTSLNKLTIKNYELLIVPVSQMSTAAANKIQAYINSGGCVWFLNDPCLTVSGESGVQLTGILGSVVSGTTSSATTITVDNTDDITNGLPATFKPVGTTSQASIFRTFSTPTGTISGLNYQILMSSGNAAMLVKFENMSNGARVIYSNPNMFISGGTASYFNAQTASKLFIKTKAWIMKFAQNPSGIEVTYPNSDKQLTVTSDDHECVPWDAATIDPMINAETSLGLKPSALNTFYIIPSSDMVSSQLTYYSQYGDTHTLHPHWTVWDDASLPLATYMEDIADNKAFVNNAADTSDYVFTSWRFPMTTYCANSMQAVANSGFTIETSNGVDGYLVGSPTDNTLFLPKQVLVNNAKGNIIEYELPAGLDLDYGTGAEFANANNVYSNQFKYGNFPMNFVICGHYQGMATNCGVDGWGVTSTGLTSGLKTILSTQQSANPNFANINTLANYINGVRGSTITGTSNGAVTTINVMNTQPITNFTLKTTLGNVVSATCDGVAARVKQDSFTGNTYVTATLAKTGAHKFVITGTNTPGTKPVAKFTAAPNPVTVGNSVHFDGSASTGTGLTYVWKLTDPSGAITTIGNGALSFDKPFTTVGTYTVQLKVTDSAGISDSTTTTVTVNSPTTLLTLSKSANPTTYNAVGQKIKYSYTVKNTATVSVRGVSITDSKIARAITVGTLKPGASETKTATYTITQADIAAGSVSNSATATGTSSGKTVTSNTATTTVTSTFVPSPALTITKTPHKNTYKRVGNTITYTYSVKNTGNVPITGIKVTDNKTKVSLESSGTLAVGSSVEGESNYNIKQADITAGSVSNSAYATGKYNGQDVTSKTVTATVTYRK